MTAYESAKVVHNFIVTQNIQNNKTFRSGRSTVRIIKVSEADYSVSTDKVNIRLSLTEEGIKIKKFKENENISGCIQRGAISFLFSLFEKIHITEDNYGK